MNTTKAFRISVSGKVQGVFFRKSTEQKARELGIKGFVRNEDDGSVLIEAEGQASAMTALVNWAKHGPPGAEVRSVQQEETDRQGYMDFKIRQ
ncbi:MAG: acylphosphatase [Owenweeksia sp.]|nr:acylphosphatase [Owenweeksia sp.]